MKSRFHITLSLSIVAALLLAVFLLPGGCKDKKDKPLFPVPVVAAEPAEFVLVGTPNHPDFHIGMMAYDAARKVMVLCNFYALDNLRTVSTWEYDGLDWVEKLKEEDPVLSLEESMHQAGLYFDTASQKVRQAYNYYRWGFPGGLLEIAVYIREWSGSDWANISSFNLDLVEYESCGNFEYDAARNVFLGICYEVETYSGPGYTGAYNWGSAILEFEGADWTIKQSGKPDLNLSTPIYDPALGKVCIKGNCKPDNPFGFPCVLSWDGGQLVEIQSGIFSPFDYLTLSVSTHAVDTDRNVIVAYGGYLASPCAMGISTYAAHSEWTGEYWLDYPDPEPGKLQNVALAYDSDRMVMMLYGGYTVESGPHYETWEMISP